MKDQDIDFLYFMQGVMNSYGKLSDGAWQTAGEEAVEHFNAEFKHDYNPKDAFLYYCKNAGDL